MPNFDKFKRYIFYNSFIGFMVGDAMGATTEFMTPKTIKEKYGKVEDIIGGGWLDLEPGETTDDTQMMMCIIKAVNEVGLKDQEKTLNKIKQNFIDWKNTKPKDIGNQCRKAIAELEAGRTVEEDGDALGNGALMRALPLTLINEYSLNVQQARLTHNNFMQEEYIKNYMTVIKSMIKDNSVTEFVYDLQEAPGGFIKDTWEAVKYHICNARDFESEMIRIVNNGGDADTIGAIAGGIIGLKYTVPDKWKNLIEEKNPEYIDEIKKFIDCYVI